MEFKNLLVKVEDGIGWIIVNRPEKLNALNWQTVEELDGAFAAFAEDDAVRVVIFTGSGEKAFVAGADITELVNLDEEKGRDYARKGQKVTELIESFPKPVIAGLNGFALGGGTEFAMACHVRVASTNAKMGQPEVKIGLIPGYGGTQRLPRLVGKGRALELLLTGRTIDAPEAFRLGLVNAVVAPEELHKACVALAKEMTANAPLALGLVIKAVNKGLDRPLDEALEKEAKYFGRVCATEDSVEGTKAFLEKRKPNFRGR
ncbi:MAG: enoyl-CoA hydratase/isomerase family protein [Candidatus Aminicenantes bacterium]|nr:enoyl-CoA hydratase/isomerase family protein [Candidatus Aminicenantes bacterium]